MAAESDGAARKLAAVSLGMPNPPAGSGKDFPDSLREQAKEILDRHLKAIGGRAEFITFSLDGNSSWNPVTWIHALRSGRAGNSLRPESVPPPK